MDQAEIVRMRMQLCEQQRTICDLSMELHRRDLLALEAAAAMEAAKPGGEPEAATGNKPKAAPKRRAKPPAAPPA